MPKGTSKSDSAWLGLSTLVHLRNYILKASLTIVFSYITVQDLPSGKYLSVAIDFFKNLYKKVALNVRSPASYRLNLKSLQR